MKKRNILYVAVALILGAFISACNDQFLEDKEMYGKFGEGIFTNEVHAGWYIDRLYYDFYHGCNSPLKTIMGSWEDRTALTEERGGISNLINPSYEAINATDCSSYFGAKLGASVVNNPYTRIRNCNYFLEGMEELGTTLPEEFGKKAKGQLLMFRAMQYFDLLRMYGGVPLVTKTLVASATDPTIKLPRASVTECVEQIIKDLDDAEKNLPDNWGAADYGRLSRAGALALKSRVLLTYASPLFNKNWDNATDDRWEQALQAGLTAEQELSAHGYGLYGKTAADWDKMFLVDNKACSEAIIVKLLTASGVTSAENNGWENSIRLKSQQGSGNGIAAPKEMIDLFPMRDGSMPTVENGYDPNKFFLNRDPRFYRTFAFSGCKWGHKEDEKNVVWTYRWLYFIEQTDEIIKYGAVYSDDNNTNTPAIVRKMTNLQASTDEGLQYSGTDIFDYRYAELLLNIAECYAAKGDVDKCIEYLGRIRQRVGIPTDNNYGIGHLSDKYAALRACLYERRVELAYEGKRFWDIQRWMLYNDDAQNNNNTCAKLGLTPLNETCRTSFYWTVKGRSHSKDVNPLEEERKSVSVDINSADMDAQLKGLANFYDQHFEIQYPDVPWDNVNSEPVTLGWRQHYYLWGLDRVALENNPWLEQTKGWKDLNNAFGTYDYQN